MYGIDHFYIFKFRNQQQNRRFTPRLPNSRSNVIWRKFMALLKNVTRRRSALFSTAAIAAVGFFVMTTQSDACFFGERHSYRHSSPDMYVGDWKAPHAYRTRGWLRGDDYAYRRDRSWRLREAPLVKGWRWRDGPLVRGWRKHDRRRHR